LARSYLHEPESRSAPDFGGDFYRQFFEQAAESLVVFEVSPEGRPVRLLAVSEEACTLIGLSRDELMALDPSELRLGPLDDCDAQFNLLIGDTVRMRTSLPGGADGIFDVEIVARLLQLDGRVCLVASARDSQPSPHWAEQMRIKEGQLALCEEIASVGTVKWDIATDTHQWSDGYYRLMGVEPGSVPNRFESFLESVHPDDLKVVEAQVAQAFKTGQLASCDVRVIWPDGSIHIMRGRTKVEFNADGSPRTFYVTGQDVTEERAMIDALRQSEYSLAVAQRQAAIGCVDWDLLTNEGTWSDEFYRILGLEPGEVDPSYDNFMNCVHVDDRKLITVGLQRMRETGDGLRVDVRMVAADGTEKVIRTISELSREGEGRVVRQFTSVQDVTALKELQQQARVGETFLLKVQELAHLGNWVVDLSTGITAWSDELYQMCGIEPGDWDGRVESFLSDICHPRDRDMARTVFERMAETLEVQEDEYMVVWPDGQTRLLLTRGEAIFDEFGKPTAIVGATWDVTEIRAATDALRRSEERLELAAHGSSDGLWDWSDISEDSYWVSPRYAELLGYDPQEFPASARASAELLHADDLPRARAMFARHINDGVPYDVEVRIRRCDDTYRWFRIRGQVHCDAEGQPHRMAGSLLDVDERKRSEEKLNVYHEQLRLLAERVTKAAERERRRIGADLHDRTIQSLGFLRVKLAEFRAGMPSDGYDPKLLEEIFALTEGTIRDTRSLLQELSPPVLYELGFAPAVEWLAERAEQRYGYTCRVDCRALDAPLDDDTEVVLFQAVRELLANAGKHAKAGAVEVTAGYDRNELVVSVADDGQGFAPDEVATGPTERGGFGLFSIRERLRVLEGTLEIRSEGDQGSTIVLRLPTGGGETLPAN
jgi:PAS domain S-box-containing protein